MIRRATPDDAEDLARVRVAAWRVAYAGLLPDSFLASMDVAQNAARWREVFDAGDHEDFVCVVGDTLVGYVTVGPNRDGAGDSVGEVIAIYLAPEVWGRGLGGLLWDAALERLREQGFRQVVVWMLQGNRRARRFYERRRLRLEAKRNILIGGAEVLEYRYRLDLTDGQRHGGWLPLFRRLLGALRGPA